MNYSHTKLIYFIVQEDGLGPIKIGCSDQPHGRLETYQRWSPVRLKLAATAVGGHPHERLIHNYFDDCRMHHEWFKRTPAVVRLLNTVVKTGRLPPPFNVGINGGPR